MARLHVWVEGKVQGVFFRAHTRREAVELGLRGWVKNLPDGRVEAVFQGEREACQRVMAFVRTGPPGAVVTKVDHVWEKDDEVFSGFEVRY